MEVFQKNAYLSLHSGAGSLTNLAREKFANKECSLLRKSFYEIVSLLSRNLAVSSKLREICAAAFFIDDLLQTLNGAGEVIQSANLTRQLHSSLLEMVQTRIQASVKVSLSLRHNWD